MSPFSVTERLAMMTGGSSGIGLDSARAFGVSEHG